MKTIKHVHLMHAYLDNNYKTAQRTQKPCPARTASTHGEGHFSSITNANKKHEQRPVLHPPCEYIWIAVFMKPGMERGECSYPTVEEPAADVLVWAGWGRPPRWPPRDAEGTSAHLVKENMAYR